MYADKYPYWTQQKNLPVFRTPKDKVMLRPLGDTSSGNFSFPFHDYPAPAGLSVFPISCRRGGPRPPAGAHSPPLRMDTNNKLIS